MSQRRALRAQSISLNALTVVGFALAAAGCQALSHSEAKVEAQRRWSEVRGRVKYQLAEQQHQAGLFDEAARSAVESIALVPTEAKAYALLARANLELGKPASAQQALDRAESLGVTSPGLCYLCGVVMEQRGQLEAAINMYSKARQGDPHNSDYLVAQAECLVEAGRPSEASSLIEECADNLDDDGTVSALAAHIAALLGNEEQASKQYAQAHVAQPDDRLIAEELGRYLVRAKRYDQALAVLRPLVDTSRADGNGSARRALATCYLSVGDAESAKSALIEHARTHPDDALAQMLLAKSAIATHDIPTALRAVDLAERREPDSPELWLVRAVVMWKRGNLAAAASDLYDVLQNDPDDVDAHCLLAEVLQEQQRLEAARVHFRRALAIDPACAWAAAGLKSLARLRLPETSDPSPRLTSVAPEGVFTVAEH